MSRTMKTRSGGTGQVSPRLSILKILRRRKKTLKQWTSEFGINTLASAEHWCNRIGAAPPTREEWEEVFGNPDLPPVVNDPSEGIIVMIPSDFTSSDDIVLSSPEPEEEPSKTKSRKTRKKKQNQSDT